MVLWLRELGANVTGYALPAANASMFEQMCVRDDCRHIEGDVRDKARLWSEIRKARPDIILHLAAQALVGGGIEHPLETFEVNVIGTVNVLEFAREQKRDVAVVVVTSDKVYLPHGSLRAHTEDDPLGGNDPYSASKVATEWAVTAYTQSLFQPADLWPRVATARAGNVIGGGDWANDRIVPDAIRALVAARPVPVRNPQHVRPWQHVLEPLAGYLLLGIRLTESDPAAFVCPWNFGPSADGSRTVRELVETVIGLWGSGSWVHASAQNGAMETPMLLLDASKASSRLGWAPRWQFSAACERTVGWYKAHAKGADRHRLRRLAVEQIHDYMSSKALASDD